MRRMILILMLIALIFLGCQRSPQVDEDLAQKEKTIARLEDQIAQLEEKLLQLEEEVTLLEEHRSSTETFINQVVGILPGENLKKIAQLDWTYELSINGVSIADLDQVILTDSSFTLTAAEKKNPHEYHVDLSEKLWNLKNDILNQRQ